MGVLDRVIRQDSGRGLPGGGIAVKCPRCDAGIIIGNMNSPEAVRCSRCHYPMICKADLHAIVRACQNSNPNQVSCAVNILCRMAEYYPEAGTALGTLAKKYPLPMDEYERWDKILAAYAAGDEGAREWLILMCQANSELYRQCTCKNCGATNFFRNHQAGRSSCVFCHSEGEDR